MRINDVGLSIGIQASLEALSADDVPPGFEEIVDAGWVVDRDAVLLRLLLESYHGDRARFTSIFGYEVAVNGRGIPDMDLDLGDSDTTHVLLRRGVAYAWQALHGAYSHDPGLDVDAYVTVSPTLYDENEVTGNVTFCSGSGSGARYLDVADFTTGALVVLSSSECTHRLPSGSRPPQM